VSKKMVSWPELIGLMASNVLKLGDRWKGLTPLALREKMLFLGAS